MTDLSVLGTNTQVLTSSTLPASPTAQNPALILFYNDIKSANWNTPNLVNVDPWIFSVIQKLYNFNKNATNEQHSFVVSNVFYGVQTRNNISNRMTEAYQVTAFGSPISSGVDPDDL